MRGSLNFKIAQLLKRKETMAGKSTNKPITIVGYVDPVDEKDRNEGIVITTDEGEEFIVELDKEGQRLVNMIGERARVSGIVTTVKGGKNLISVSRFKILEYEEELESS